MPDGGGQIAKLMPVIQPPHVDDIAIGQREFDAGPSVLV
jgi:hypothetical protein